MLYIDNMRAAEKMSLFLTENTQHVENYCFTVLKRII